MPREVRIEYCYPRAQAFVAAHGHQGLAVLHALLQESRFDHGVLVATGSTRELATRSELMSKDTVNRRVRHLQRIGVLERIASSDSRSPVYAVHLDGLGITVTVVDDLD